VKKTKRQEESKNRKKWRICSSSEATVNDVKVKRKEEKATVEQSWAGLAGLTVWEV